MPEAAFNDSANNVPAPLQLYEDFLESGETICLPRSANPNVSIIIPFRNSPEHLLNGLHGLAFGEAESFETIVVAEKGCLQSYPELESRLDGIHFHRVDEMESFAQAWNEGASLALAPSLLFMKDDARLMERSLANLGRLLETLRHAGAVGGMFTDLGGSLIEAGGLLFESGYCSSFGRGWNPCDYRVQYKRAVAYCSGAALLFRRDLFDEIGGFDPSYLDEYYEDVDLCLRIAASGNQILYDPEFQVQRSLEHRYSWEHCAQLLETNRQILLNRHERTLALLPTQSAYPTEVFFEKASGKRILWIEDAPPFSHMGAGFPRTRAMLNALIELGHSVTLLPTFWTASDFEDVYKDTPREVEVALGVGESGFLDFWKCREERYDVVILSRPNNLKSLGPVVFESKRLRPDLKVIYDAEAVFVNRELSENRLRGTPFSQEEERALLQQELGAAMEADCVFAISETERKQFQALGFPQIRMLRHHSETRVSLNSFDERSGILFVGAVHSDNAPNALGLIDFIENALPLIRQRLNEDVILYCIGKYNSNRLLKYETESERFLGFVEDLDEWYNRCRIFVAPAQFAAGIPLKIVEAAARGIPVVGSRLAQEQFGWKSDEILSGSSGDEFAVACERLYKDKKLWSRLRSRALARVERDYSHHSIVETLRVALD